jgi:hypothetical protein
MSMQKKNVIQGFTQEDYVPAEGQQIVKYMCGEWNGVDGYCIVK